MQNDRIDGIGAVQMVAALVVLLISFGATPVFAADTWTDPAPGVRQLVRTVSGPNRIVATVIDLGRPDLYLRVTRPGERGKTTTSWAQSVGAVVAINGDWFGSGYQPTGLSVGDGEHWAGTADNGWSFMACTVEKRCVFDDHTVNQGRYHLWHDVVGGNGWRLMVDGVVPTYPADAFYTARNPRSGVGLSADGKTMVLIAVEGRRADSIGMGFAEFAQVFKDLGAHQAMMLDGGGSTSLVVNGSRQNRLPSAQGSERVVANHLGILRGTASAECAGSPNGRYCAGSVIHTCRGGQHVGQGDCGAFGASCGVTAEGIGTCVHPYCTGGANGSFCENETEITTCDNGALGGTGDCAAYGATCETGASDSYCVHYLCSEGANSTWCREDGMLATCVDGQPQDDVDCSSGGQVCAEGACVDPEAPVDGSTNNGAGDVDEPVPDTGTDDSSEDASNNASDGGSLDGETAGGDDAGGMDGTVTSAEGRAGCSTSTSSPSPLLLLLGLLFAGVRRRR